VIVGRRTALTLDFERLMRELEQSLVRLHEQRDHGARGLKGLTAKAER